VCGQTHTPLTANAVGGPPAWGLGKELTNTQRKKKPVMKHYTGDLVNTVMSLQVP